MKKNILFMNGAYLPKTSPNGNCVKQVLDKLFQLGHNVALITKETDVNQKKIDNIDGVKVYRVNENILMKIIFFTDKSEKKLSKLITSFTLFLLRIKGSFFAFAYPLLSIALVLRYYFKAKELIRLQKFETVVAVYKSFEAVVAGVFLKRKYPQLRFIVYTLDSIAGGFIPTVLRSRKVAFDSIKRWEKLIFNYADTICVMKSHEKHYLSSEYDCYRHKIEYMDIPLLNISNNKLKNKSNKDIDIVFTGSMATVTANPVYFIKILKKLENIKFHIYGSISDEIQALFDYSGLIDKKIFIYGTISPNNVITVQENADILVNFGNNNPNMIPCKIFEYLSRKRPVLSFYKADSDACKFYFDNYDGVLQIFEEDSELDENCDKIRDFILNLYKIKFDDEYILKRYYDNTPFPMVEEILR